MARAFDSPLILDRSRFMYARAGRSIKRDKVVILRILNTFPSDLHPLSAVLKCIVASAELYVVVKGVPHVMSLILFKRIMHVMSAGVLCTTDERYKCHYTDTCSVRSIAHTRWVHDRDVLSRLPTTTAPSSWVMLCVGQASNHLALLVLTNRPRLRTARNNLQ